MNRSYILFECIGDAEKNLLGSVIVYLLKLKYPEKDIIVISNLSTIWLHNPNVYRVYTAGSLHYFYEDYIENRDTLIFRQDPYKTADFIHGNHILSAWATLCGVVYNGEKPVLHFTQREKEVVERLTKRSKPLALFHPFDASPKEPFARQWARNIPIELANDIAYKLKNQGFHIIAPSIPDVPQIAHVEYIQLPLRLLLLLPFVSEKIICCHSAIIYSSISLHKKVTTIWAGNSPMVWGYTNERNILPIITMPHFVEPWSYHLLSDKLPQLTKNSYSYTI